MRLVLGILMLLAHEDGEIGENHEPETHLIPNILKSIIANKKTLKVFGNDYPTPTEPVLEITYMLMILVMLIYIPEDE